MDDSALQALQRDRELLSCVPHFHQVGDVLHVSLLVSWQEAPVAAEVLDAARAAQETGRSREPRGGGQGREQREDPTAGLSEADRSLYQTLRRWRSETSRKDGVPPYVLLTNKELLAVVLKRPASRNALSQVEGFGPAKMKRYADSLLRVLQADAAEHNAPGSGALTAASSGAGVTKDGVGAPEPAAGNGESDAGAQSNDGAASAGGDR